MEMTRHAVRRSQSRSIGPTTIERLVQYGIEYNAGNGCSAYFIGRRPEEMRDMPELMSCRNKAVVLHGDTVITVHHCQRPPRSWRRMCR